MLPASVTAQDLTSAPANADPALLQEPGQAAASGPTQATSASPSLTESTVPAAAGSQADPGNTFTTQQVYGRETWQVINVAYQQNS